MYSSSLKKEINNYQNVRYPRKLEIIPNSLTTSKHRTGLLCTHAVNKLYLKNRRRSCTSIPNEKAIYTSNFINANKVDMNWTNPNCVVNGKNVRLNQLVTIGEYAINYKLIPQLRKEKRVLTRRKIPKNCVLGMYVGNEYLANEWSDKFDYTEKDTQHRRYLYTMKVNDKTIVIDPMDAELIDSPLLYINDIRKDLTNCTNATSDEICKQNIKFLEIEMDGWKSIFLISCKTIPRNTELLTDYGYIYPQTMKQCDAWENYIKNVSS